MQMEKQKEQRKLSIQDIALVGVMVAVIEVSKAALAFLPNIELTSFWVILFTLMFEWKILFVVPVFILTEGTVYGFGLWWIMYLYAWPLLALLAWIFRRQESAWFWSVLSGGFGLMFGFLCAIPYAVLGAAGDGGFRDGLVAGLVGGRHSLGYRPCRWQFRFYADIVPSGSQSDVKYEKVPDQVKCHTGERTVSGVTSG